MKLIHAFNQAMLRPMPDWLDAFALGAMVGSALAGTWACFDIMQRTGW